MEPFDVIKVSADEIANISAMLAKIESKMPSDRGLRENEVNSIRTWLLRSAEMCEALSLRMTKIQLERVAAKLEASTDAKSGIRSGIADANQRFHDELASNCFLQLSSSEAAMYECSEPFGSEVAATFPEVSYDIEEATKCLGLGRTTATVFHLMRSMECAVQLLAGQLGISNIEREWGKLLADMKTKVEAMPKGSDRDAWSENMTLLYHVKQAWRNDVMHPRATYTEEQAKEIHDAVRSFMRNLAALVKR
jgi:HEPN domain-containing protein